MKVFESSNVTIPVPSQILESCINYTWLCQLTLFSSKIEPFFKYFDTCCFAIWISVNKNISLQKDTNIKDIFTKNEYAQFVSNLQKT